MSAVTDAVKHQTASSHPHIANSAGSNPNDVAGVTSSLNGRRRRLRFEHTYPAEEGIRSHRDNRNKERTALEIQSNKIWTPNGVSTPNGQESISLDRLGFERMDNFLATPDKPIEWLVDSLLQHPSVNMVVGAGGSYKSLFCQMLALAVASGNVMLHPKFDVPKPRTVVYVQDESSARGLRRRFQKLVHGLQIEREATQRLWLRSNKGFNIDKAADYKRIHKAAEHADLLIFDAFRDIHSKDENSSQEMTELVSMFRELRDQYQTTVIIVHHTNKNPDNQGGAARTRGSTRIWDGVDGRWPIRLYRGWARVGDEDPPGLYQKDSEWTPPFRFRPKFGTHTITYEFEFISKENNNQTGHAGKDANWSRVIEAIEELQPVTEKAIIAKTRLGKGTVGRLLKEMRKQGVISREAKDLKNGKRIPNKPYYYSLAENYEEDRM